jgi:hypothetical protein
MVIVKRLRAVTVTPCKMPHRERGATFSKKIKKIEKNA